MPYTPVGWEDVPSEKTPIDADNLNHMDEQIKANAEALVPASTENIGLVKPDGETITIDEDGTIHGRAIGDVELIMNTQKLTTGNSYQLLTNATNYKELYFVFSSAYENALFDVKRIHTSFAMGVTNRLCGRYDVAEGVSSNYQIGISTDGQTLNCAYASNSNPSFELMLSIYGCL